MKILGSGSQKEVAGEQGGNPQPQETYIGPAMGGNMMRLEKTQFDFEMMNSVYPCSAFSPYSLSTVYIL